MPKLLRNLFLMLSLSVFLLSCSSDKSAPTQPNDNATNNVIPYSPQPKDNEIDQPVALTLNWNADSTAKFDIYFDQHNPPQTIFVSDISTMSVIISNLNYNTTYYWKVVAKYSDGYSIEGPIWRFTTIDGKSGANKGYALFLDRIGTSAPNYVNVMFHVTDLYGNGITYLTADSFEVSEDFEPLSLSESRLQIKRYDTVPYTIKTVLMLDNSTSLQNDIDRIRDAATLFINNLIPNQEIAVYQFSENIEMLTDFTSDKNILYDALQDYFVGNASTNLYGAVKKGTSLWGDTLSIDEIVSGTMIIFTDGHDTQGSVTLAEAINAVRNKSVFAIGLGNEIRPEILTKIATAGYYSISDTNQLLEKFNNIQRSIVAGAGSFYLLSYKSPRRGNINHTITIRIKNNSHTGESSFITGIFNSGDFTSAKSNSF